MALTTAAVVIAEGSLCKEQFPLTQALGRTQEEFEALVAARVDEAAGELKRRVGDTNYGTTDPEDLIVLTTAETCLATGKLFNTMTNIIAAWDAEALPSELVDGDRIAAQRDWYFQRYGELSADFAVEDSGRGGMPILIARGALIEMGA